MQFQKETNIDGVRISSKLLLNCVKVVPIECGIVQHPYTNSIIVADADANLINLRNPDDLKNWTNMISSHIDELTPLKIFALLINPPWYLTWLSFIKQHLSREDFSKLLGDAWTLEENPNMDANVSTKEAIAWFKTADKKALMTDDEYTVWENLPDMVEVYRGVGTGRKKYGLLFTTNREKAEWFRDRWNALGDDQTILRGVIPKKYCLAYFNRRDEDELVVNVYAVKRYLSEI